LHFNNALNSLKTSVGGENRYPSNRAATWRYLCPRSIGEYIHLWRTPSLPPPPQYSSRFLWQGIIFHLAANNFVTSQFRERRPNRKLSLLFPQNGSWYKAVAKPRFYDPLKFYPVTCVEWAQCVKSRTLLRTVNNYVWTNFQLCLISVTNSARKIGWYTLHAQYRHKQEYCWTRSQRSTTRSLWTMRFWTAQNARDLTSSRTNSQCLRKDMLLDLVTWLVGYWDGTPQTRYKYECLDVTIPTVLRF
jgi:hypothetical protein